MSDKMSSELGFDVDIMSKPGFFFGQADTLKKLFILWRKTRFFADKSSFFQNKSA